MSRGEASVLGVDLTGDRRAIRSRVGLLGHDNGLYEDLSVAENVRFWGRTVGATAAEIDTALARLGLAGRLAGTAVGRLSAGQRRRTALAALVARRPELWLLDEPHAGLDAEGRDLIDELLRTAAAAGATVVVASHERERAAGLAQRAVAVDGGLVFERAEPAAPAERDPTVTGPIEGDPAATGPRLAGPPGVPAPPAGEPVGVVPC